MKHKLAVLLALLPIAASAATYTMKVPTKGLKLTSSTAAPSSPGGSGPSTPVTPPAPNTPVLNGQEISYGGLTIARAGDSRMNYAAATAACAGTLNNKTGWRLVNQAEWNSIYNAAGASMFAAAGYDMSTIGWVWHTEPWRNGQRLVSRPVDNLVSVADEVDPWYTVCVRAS